MRRSIIVLIVVGIIVTAAVLVDIFAKGMAERAVATSVQEGLDLDEEPDVAIGGFPFIVNLLNGVVPEVSLDAENVGRGRVRFDLVTLKLSNVRLDTSALISGEAESIRIGGGRGRAVMSGATLSRLLQREGVDATIEFIDGEVIVSPEGSLEQASGDLSLEGRNLVLSSPLLPESVSLPLPVIAEGLTYRALEIGEGQALLEVGLSAGEFRLPEG
ncbi:MAG: DUF2993 domain-containing protein [Actinobacteria bacterium]|nr:DUF2993 domain-containing protein [Actinomycetota bacterium]